MASIPAHRSDSLAQHKGFNPQEGRLNLTPVHCQAEDHTEQWQMQTSIRHFICSLFLVEERNYVIVLTEIKLFCVLRRVIELMRETQRMSLHKK